MAEPETQELGQEMADTAASEPKIEAAIPAMQPKQRGSSVFLGLVVGGALAAVGGFGLARYVVPEGWPLQSTTALEAKLAEQSTQIAALKADLAQTSAAIAGLPSEGRIAALEAALSKEQSTSAAPVDEGRFTALESRLTDLEQRPIAQTVTPSAPSAAAEAAAKARLAEAEAQTNALKAEAEAIAKTTALRAALVEVQAAIDSGQPFSLPLAALQSSGLSIPEALQSAATNGVPTLKSLQSTFPDAARRALDAALRANMGETTTDRLTSFLRTQTGVRSLTPRDGTDPDAILSRAEAALAAGDLATTFAEVAALPAEAQAAIADWQAMAKMRAKALDGLATLAAEIQ